MSQQSCQALLIEDEPAVAEPIQALPRAESPREFALSSMDQYLLRLYLAGNSLRSQQAIANIYRICREALNNQSAVEIIDVLEQPHRAEQEKVMVTPTLIKQLPPPLQRIIGDMSNAQRVLLGLDILPTELNFER